MLVALSAGALVYVVLHALLVRPMRRIIGSIVAFRADPERALPLDPDSVAPLPDDEIAAASRELATLQRELRAALWRNARLAALGAAMSRASHDLRGILSPALLTAERLQMHEDERIRRAGDVLVRAVERATELVRRTVEFAREGPPAPGRVPVNLSAAVIEAAEQVNATTPRLLIDNAVPSGLLVEADSGELVRVFANLLRNAGEAGARHVAVRAAPAGTDIEVTIEDDGPGLPERVVQSLFRPFVAGGRPGGSGLGLAIAHDLVHAQGGALALLRTGQAGTAFRLTLPAIDRGRVATASAQAAGSRKGAGVRRAADRHGRDPGARRPSRGGRDRAHREGAARGPRRAGGHRRVAPPRGRRARAAGADARTGADRLLQQGRPGASRLRRARRARASGDPGQHGRPGVRWRNFAGRWRSWSRSPKLR